ncbi:hypothetical protein QUF50_05030 [Thiotrichales bacterium HSG1]|nr:hypothetical protein [Thiotrichales bacterium HSG1]
MHNPFIYPTNKIIGREREINTVIGRIVTGQSTFISGSPRSGKTSILNCFSANHDLYNDIDTKLIFSEWNAGLCTPELTQIDFWKRVLIPLKEYIEDNEELLNIYKKCEESNFKSHQIESLINKIKKAGLRLVVLIDRLDILLKYDNFNNHEFFAGLRVKASYGESAFVLVVTANISRNKFDEKTKGLVGSPYFNFMDEIILGALSDKTIDEFLCKKQAKFEETDRNFIKNLAGGHPYLLQIVASSLWEVREYEMAVSSLEVREYENDIEKQYSAAESSSYAKAENTLTNIWMSWERDIQEVFSSIAFVQNRDKLNDKLNIEGIKKEIPNRKTELSELEKYGFIKKDDGDWCIYPSIFLQFMFFISKDEYKRDKYRA